MERAKWAPISRSCSNEPNLFCTGGSKPTPRPTNEPSYEFVYNDVEYSVDKNSLKPGIQSVSFITANI